MDMASNLEEMTPDERKRIEYLTRVARILRMPPDELIKECDEIMKICWVYDARPPKPWDESAPYIPLALR